MRPPTHFTRDQRKAWRDLTKAIRTSRGLVPADLPLLEKAATLVAEMRRRKADFPHGMRLIKLFDKLGMTPMARVEQQGTPLYRGGRNSTLPIFIGDK